MFFKFKSACRKKKCLNQLSSLVWNFPIQIPGIRGRFCLYASKSFSSNFYYFFQCIHRTLKTQEGLKGSFFNIKLAMRLLMMNHLLWSNPHIFNIFQNNFFNIFSYTCKLCLKNPLQMNFDEKITGKNVAMNHCTDAF